MKMVSLDGERVLGRSDRGDRGGGEGDCGESARVGNIAAGVVDGESADEEHGRSPLRRRGSARDR